MLTKNNKRLKLALNDVQDLLYIIQSKVLYTLVAYTACIDALLSSILPLPFLLEHTTHTGCDGLPLAQVCPFSGKCRSVSRAGGGRALR